MFELDEPGLFGITAVENLFIKEYMADAEGDYIKVYLMGLYLCQHRTEGLQAAEFAASLGMETDRVEAALRYWERRLLIRRKSNKPPLYVFQHAVEVFLNGKNEMMPDPGFVRFSESVYAQFGNRRKLKPTEIALAYDWSLDLKLPEEVVLMLLNHQSETRGINFSFKSAQALAAQMAEQKISTSEEAEQFFSHSRRSWAGARAVLKALNFRRMPTEPELALYRVWSEEWGFEDEAILSACSETVKTGSPSFAYLNGILERIKNSGTSRNQSQVSGQIAKESFELREVRDIISILGLPSSSATAVLPAYRRLRERYDAALLQLAAESARARGEKFEELETKITTWSKLGLNSAAEVREHLKGLKVYQPLMIRVFDLCGIQGRVGEEDLLRLRGWIQSGHSESLILLAAEKARSASQKLSYIQKTLDNWAQSGIRTTEAAQNAMVPQQASIKQVAAQKYTQRNYTEDTLPSGLSLIEEAKNDDAK